MLRQLKLIIAHDLDPFKYFNTELPIKKLVLYLNICGSLHSKLISAYFFIGHFVYDLKPCGNIFKVGHDFYE